MKKKIQKTSTKETKVSHSEFSEQDPSRKHDLSFLQHLKNPDNAQHFPCSLIFQMV